MGASFVFCPVHNDDLHRLSKDQYAMSPTQNAFVLPSVHKVRSDNATPEIPVASLCSARMSGRVWM